MGSAHLTVYLDDIQTIGVGGSTATSYATSSYLLKSASTSLSSLYKIELFDPVFDYTKFYNANLTKKIMQVDSFSCSFYDVTINDTEQYLLENAPLRLKINNRPMFVGIIKRVEKDDNRRTISIVGEGNACILRDRIVNIEQKYTRTNAMTIVASVLPSTNWTLLYDVTDAPLDYTINAGSALSHISNICKLKGWEWTTNIEFTEPMVISVTTATTFVLNWYPPAYLVGYYGVVTTGTDIDKGFTITSITDNTIQTSTTLSGVVAGDYMLLWGKHQLYVTDRLGTAGSILTATNNLNCTNLQFATNLDKTFNDITVTGVTAEMIGATSNISYNTLQIATLNCNETYLLENASSGATQLWVKDATDFTSSATYIVGSEKVTVTDLGDVSTSWRLNVTRAIGSTTAAQHYVNDDIMFVDSITVTDTTGLGFTAPGTIWIGKEKIEYTDTGATSFSGLTRGVSDGGIATPKYAHYKGTLVRTASIDNSNPAAASSVGIYGIRSKRYEGYGIRTQDGLDKYAGNIMLKNFESRRRGTFTYLDTDIWKAYELGSTITVVDKAGSSATFRIVGVEYNQYKPVNIEFGFVDNYILDSFSQVDSVSNIAAQKGQNLKSATVLSVTSDGKKAQVKLNADGTTHWVDV